jgi:hypothetical protein
MSSLFQIVYTSTATDSLDQAKLKELLKGSVRRNTQAGITGLLLFKDGCFMQVLEGEKTKAKALFAKIRRDPRHHRIIPLIQEPTRQRYFPDSAMAFQDLKTPELLNLPGYSEFLNTPLNGDLYVKDIPKCQRLLLLFKKNIR